MNRSYLIAGTITFLMVGWMLSGLTGCGAEEGLPEEPMADASPPPILQVQVRSLEAEEIAREVRVPGRTAAARLVDVRAETGGRVATILAERGTPVSVGQPILQIDPEDRPERLAQAQASLNQAKLEYDAAQRLQAKNLQAASQVAAAKAMLEAAESQVKALQLDLDKTTIRAPFAGRLQSRPVEVGDFIEVGQMVARVIELDPLVVTGDATELQIDYLHEGEHGYAELADGRVLEGHLRYVASEGHPETRTFQIELEVPNPGNAVPAGMTAEIRIETERVMAHEVSPAYVSIADDGRFGIKYVDAEQKVQFAEADIVKSSPQSLWLGSLPDQIELITVGQGFAQPGDRVDPSPEKGLLP